MEIELINSLKSEEKTINHLLKIGFISFLSSLILEYVIPVFLDRSLLNRIHINYINNFLLGIVASSFISFLGLLYIFNAKKNEQLNNVIIPLKIIYFRYYIIINYIFTIIENGNTCDDYFAENFLLKKSKDLENKIEDIIVTYEKSDFKSEKISHINTVLQGKVKFNLSLIIEFCRLIITLENTNGINNQSGIKQIVDKRSERDNYLLLLSNLQSNYSIEEVTNLFSTLDKNITISFLKYNADNLKELADQIFDDLNANKLLALSNDMLFKIMDNYTKHTNAYQIEYLNAMKEINKVSLEFGKIGNEFDVDDKIKVEVELIISKMRKSVEKDCFQNLDQLNLKIYEIVGNIISNR